MKVKSQLINLGGPVGNIQAMLDLPDEAPDGSVPILSEGSASQYISVNCHPHSLYGGTMTNKVVHTISKAIAGLGVPSLRFNFRGVGDSEGVYDGGKGEQLDLLATLDWMNKRYPGNKLILTGFSFGSYVAALASASIQPEMLLTVAPPVKRFDFDGFVRPDSAWSVIMGTADELVDFADVETWANSFLSGSDRHCPNLIAMAGASHFFHGRLVELREHIEACVSQLIIDS